MAERKVLCEVVTPERMVYAGEVDMVIAPGADGELGILPFHAPLITLLNVGELRVKIDNQQEYIAIHGGYLEVSEDRVTVLAQAAELASQIDVERAREAQQKSEKELAEAMAGDVPEEDIARLQQALSSAALRLKLAAKKKQ